MAKTLHNLAPWAFVKSEEDYRNIFQDAWLTLDASTILDLYRLQQEAVTDLRSLIEKFEGRLFISSQTLDEFLRAKRKTESEFSKRIINSDELTSKILSSLVEVSNIKQIDSVIRDRFGSKAKAFVGEFIRLHSELIGSTDNIQESRTLIDWIDQKFILPDMWLDKSLTEISQKRAEWQSECEARYQSEIPPGYKDASKDSNSCGDFFMWYEVIEFAKTKSVPVVLLTSDTKEDWFERFSGETQGPRVELLREFYDNVGNEILIYTPGQFLKIASAIFHSELNENSVENIESLSGDKDKPADIYGKVDENSSSISSVSGGNNRSEIKKSWPAVHVTQFGEFDEVVGFYGKMKVELIRSVVNFTASGKIESVLDRRFLRVSATLIKAPIDLPNYTISAAPGVHNDFHIHLRSRGGGRTLPIGTYYFEYWVSEDSQEELF